MQLAMQLLCMFLMHVFLLQLVGNDSGHEGGGVEQLVYTGNCKLVYQYTVKYWHKI